MFPSISFIFQGVLSCVFTFELSMLMIISIFMSENVMSCIENIGVVLQISAQKFVLMTFACVSLLSVKVAWQLLIF